MINIASPSPSRQFSLTSAAAHPRSSAPDDGVAAQQRRTADRTATDDARTALPGGKRELTDEERQQVEELKRIDTHVRQHEAAHQAAAGGLARGKSFTYKQGPDGKQYAVAGEVQIDTSAVPGDPQATIAKMQRVRAAALAPSDPSSQDRSVAAEASRVEAEARAELLSPQEGQQTQNVSLPTSSGAVTAQQHPDASTTNNRTTAPFAPYSLYERRGAFINAYA